ncbi:winged helix-turn-helix transcriptional regulator [Oleomonas cavernae]|nr:helix-turn-helix domain-containing protein [Oleomonas cavernae]
MIADTIPVASAGVQFTNCTGGVFHPRFARMLSAGVVTGVTMDGEGGYGQFCPVAMASEILCSRWTVLVVRELLCGTTRFNDLRRGVPRMSPTLLSKRLKELERAGVIAAVPNAKGVAEYRLTPAGEDLRPIVLGMGFWGQRWVESQLSLKNLDPSLLMWDMRRNLNPQPLPPRRCTIQFQYPELPQAKRNWWLVVDDGKVDLCGFDPGFDVDLLVTSSLRIMTAIWMGIAVARREIEDGRLELDGDPAIAGAMQRWLGLSTFAAEPRRVP